MTDEWSGLLAEGEVILWQGTPQIGLRFEWETPAELLGSLFFMGFALFWMTNAPSLPDPAGMFGLLLLCVGFYNLVPIHFWKAYKRRNTQYTLTNKRAIIGTLDVLRGKRLENYPITESTALSLQEGKLTTIDFATKTVGSGKLTRVISIGFEDLPNGRDVYALMRKVQEGTA